MVMSGYWWHSLQAKVLRKCEVCNRARAPWGALLTAHAIAALANMASMCAAAGDAALVPILQLCVLLQQAGQDFANMCNAHDMYTRQHGEPCRKLA